MKSLELKIPPPLVGLAFAGAMFVAERAVPALSFMLSRSVAIALALVVSGVLLALAGILAFRRERTTVNPLNPSASSTVVSRGVYRLSRNPMYLGILLALAGWAVYLSNGLAFLFLPGFVAYMTRFQIKPEERVLLAKFGAPFGTYMSRVRRWI